MQGKAQAKRQASPRMAQQAGGPRAAGQVAKALHAHKSQVLHHVSPRTCILISQRPSDTTDISRVGNKALLGEGAHIVQGVEAQLELQVLGHDLPQALAHDAVQHQHQRQLEEERIACQDGQAVPIWIPPRPPRRPFPAEQPRPCLQQLLCQARWGP